MKIKFKISSFLILICFLFFLLLINNYYSYDIHLTRIEVDKKEHTFSNSDIIYSTSADDEKFVFHLSAKEKIFVGMDSTHSNEVEISEVWNEIIEGEEYFITFKNNFQFPFNLLYKENKILELRLY